MCCELHTKISECEELETQLRVKLGLVRSRRKHFQETLQMLEEPVSASYAALDAVYDVDHTLDPKRSLLAWTQTLDSEDEQLKISQFRTPYSNVALRLALKNDREVRIPDVAHEIQALRLSDAKYNSICSTLYKQLSKHYMWEQVAPGTFRLKD